MVSATQADERDADSLLDSLNTPNTVRLSPAELYFCELIHNGWSQAKAWLKANPQSKMNPKWANSVGCKLAKSPPILAHLAKLRNGSATAQQSSPLLISSVLDRDAKRVWLAEVVRDSSFDIAARLRALELDSRLAGHDAPKTTVALTGPLSMAKELLDRYAQRPEKLALPAATLAPTTNELPKLASIPAPYCKPEDSVNPAIDATAST